MNRTRTFLVARREYVENLRTKTFWIGISFFPIMLIISIVVPTWLSQKKDVRRYAVLDHSGWLLAAVEERADSPDLEKVLRKALEDYRKGGSDFEKLPEFLRKVAPHLERLEEHLEIIADLFSQLESSGLHSVDLPEAMEGKISGFIRQEKENLRKWWKSLPPEEARRLAPDLSKSRYVRDDVDPSWEDPGVELQKMLNDNKLFAYFVINNDPIESATGCKYVSNNLTDNDLRQWYTNLASAEVRSRRLERQEIDKAVANWIEKPLRFESKKLDEEGEEEEVHAEDKIGQLAPIIFVYLLWASIFTIAQMLLTSTIEEKSSRIIEVLLSSVSPAQLMTGKILGLAATGLTVVGSWVAFFFVIIKLLPYLVDRLPDFDLTVLISNPTYLASFVVYFLLGYLLFATIFVGIGSVCNTLKEAQNLMLPVIVILVVPLLAMLPIGQDPNGTLARFLSYIPPFTPFVMMNRAAGPPDAFEYIVTTLLLVASIAVGFWGAGRVFRAGILMTGKPLRPLEILRIILTRSA